MKESTCVNQKGGKSGQVPKTLTRVWIVARKGNIPESCIGGHDKGFGDGDRDTSR